MSKTDSESDPYIGPKGYTIYKKNLLYNNFLHVFCRNDVNNYLKEDFIYSDFNLVVRFIWKSKFKITII